MKQHLKHGLIISIEGIDGSGKSTLARTLAEKIARSYAVTLTREPGGTRVGQTLRTILQSQEEPLVPTAEFLLFAADRAQHFATVVEPALREGSIVISDRMADSSLVYQGYARGLDKSMITTINAWAMNQRKPDITVYVAVDVSTAFERIEKRNEARTSFEKRQFIEQVKAGFEDLYTNRPDVLIIDGSPSPDAVLADAYAQVIDIIKTKESSHE